MQCLPCRSGEPAVTDDEISKLLHQIPEWNLRKKDGIKRLERQFKFNRLVVQLETKRLF